MSIRETIMRSLAAVGRQREAKFYAQLFQSQEPERFALIVLDPRCLKNPLLEALISDLRILADLELTPVLLVGALDEDRTSIRFQSQRLSKELEKTGIKTAKLNCASYGLMSDVKRQTASGRIVILEMTESMSNASVGMDQIVKGLLPAKVIFLQPSGGLRKEGVRLPVLKLEDEVADLGLDSLSSGQEAFLATARALAGLPNNQATYVIASPLNLLQELFTTKGSGTLMRRAATIIEATDFSALDANFMKSSIESAFEKFLKSDFFDKPIERVFVEKDYRGGAIVSSLAGLPYLSKFWVIQLAQGEGIARDIWDALCDDVPSFFWRSRANNPFNDWYMQACDGMQKSGDWRVFWRGLDAPEVPGAIIAAASAPDDFVSNS